MLRKGMSNIAAYCVRGWDRNAGAFLPSLREGVKMKTQQQAAFDHFWKQVWPTCRRIQKKSAADQWARIPAELYETIYAAVERQKKLPSWNTGDCKFIPYPHRWLRDRRWEDEISLPEDTDIEQLIEALQQNSSVPPDFPAHILDRFRKMCQRMRWNWPLVHQWFVMASDATAEKVRKEYSATE